MDDMLRMNLSGLFLMNDRSGTNDHDINLAYPQKAYLSGSDEPAWNTDDPSIMFKGGGSGNSYVDAGTESNFDELPTSQITIVAKVHVNTLAAAGVCEKNDNTLGVGDSGFVFGWDATGALRLTVQKTGGNMEKATIGGVVPVNQWVQLALTWDGTGSALANAAKLFKDGDEQTYDVTDTKDGSGQPRSANATNKPFLIGSASFYTGGSLDGKMAYLAIYKGRILSSGELKQLDTKLPIKSVWCQG